jgi:predicted transcriptional regulator
MLLNGVRIYQASLPNHPHDARGSLTYLRGGRGAYGYLAHATIEGVLLQEVRAYAEEHVLRLRCAVPTDGQHQGGLTIYGGAAGRYPVQPTVVIET